MTCLLYLKFNKFTTCNSNSILQLFEHKFHQVTEEIQASQVLMEQMDPKETQVPRDWYQDHPDHQDPHRKENKEKKDNLVWEPRENLAIQ